MVNQQFHVSDVKVSEINMNEGKERKEKEYKIINMV